MDILLLLLIVVGLLVYAFTNGKIAEVGRVLFACALLAMLLHGVPHLRLAS